MKRWLLWNLICHRGRRCSDLVFPNTRQIAELKALGGTVKGTYECGGCHTTYWIRTEDEPRRRCTEDLPDGDSIITGTIAGGESTTVNVPMPDDREIVI